MRRRREVGRCRCSRNLGGRARIREVDEEGRQGGQDGDVGKVLLVTPSEGGGEQRPLAGLFQASHECVYPHIELISSAEPGAIKLLQDGLYSSGL